MKLGDLFIKLGLKSQEFEQGINKAKGSVNAFKGLLKTIGVAIAGAFSVQMVVNFARQVFEIAKQAEGVRSAFERIATQGDLNKMRDAVRGTVSDLNLMKRAVQASNLGLDVKELGNLFQFAAQRAQGTGQSVDYLVDSIVLGIGRKSPLILDNLGISAIQLSEKLGGVSIAAASVGDVTRAVGEIARESLESAGGFADTLGTKVQRIESIWENFKLSLAESPKVIDTVGRSLIELEMIMTGFASTKDIARAIISPKYADELVKKYLEFVRVQNDAKSAIEEYGNNIKRARGETEVLNTVLEDSTEKVEKTEKAWDGLNVSFEASSQALINLHKHIGSLDDVLDRLGRSVKGFAPLDELTSQTGEMLGRFGFAPEQEDEFAANFTVDDNQSLKNFEQFKDEFAMLVTDFSIDVVGQFGDAMGQLIATGELPANFGNSVLDALGRFVSTLGKMLITLGIGSEAFQGLLKSGFSNPAAAVAAIAAGAALVAIGSGISSYARSRMGGGGGGGGTGMFNQSYNVNVAAAASPTSATLFLKGDDIYLSGQRNIYKRGAIG